MPHRALALRREAHQLRLARSAGTPRSPARRPRRATRRSRRSSTRSASRGPEPDPRRDAARTRSPPETGPPLPAPRPSGAAMRSGTITLRSPRQQPVERRQRPAQRGADVEVERQRPERVAGLLECRRRAPRLLEPLPHGMAERWRAVVASRGGVHQGAGPTPSPGASRPSAPPPEGGLHDQRPPVRKEPVAQAGEPWRRDSPERLEDGVPVRPTAGRPRPEAPARRPAPPGRARGDLSPALEEAEAPPHAGRSSAAGPDGTMSSVCPRVPCLSGLEAQERAHGFLDEGPRLVERLPAEQIRDEGERELPVLRDVLPAGLLEERGVPPPSRVRGGS